MWLHGWLPVTIRRHPVKSGGIGFVEEEILSFQFDMRRLVITWSESCNFTTGFISTYSAPCKVWWPYIFWWKKYFVVTLSRDLMWPVGQRDMWLHGCVHLTVSHQITKFCGFKPCQREYVTLLICHVTTNHHVVRRSWDSIGGFLSPYVTNQPCLVVIDLAKEEILSFQFVMWPHVIMWSESHPTLWVSFPRY